jgi:hypothetical protein
MPRKLVLLVAVVLAAGAVTAGIAIASGAGGHDKPLTGSSLAKASAAALAHTGGGTVVEPEVGDDGAAYDVEVRLANGRVVEVNLDASYAVIGQEADDDGANEDGPNEDGPNDDGTNEQG